MSYIKCPECEQPNPSDAEACSNCGAPLHEAIQPGDMPTKKTTSELEPILPQWLQEAREKARKTTDNDIGDPSPDTRPTSAHSDLLAGLEAQSRDDDEEVPDWLAGITGAKSRKKTPAPFSGVQRVELDGFEDLTSEENKPAPSSGEAQRPSWMPDLPAAQSSGSEDQQLQDWFKQATSAPETPGQQFAPPSGGLEPPLSQEPATTASEEASLDWLGSLGDEAPASEDPLQALEPSPEQTPSWLQAESSPSTPSDGDTGMPDWLKNLGEEAPGEETPATLPVEPLSDDWLTQFKSETPASSVDEPALVAGEAEVPDWLQGLSEDSGNVQSEPGAATEAETPLSPDWLSQLGTSELPPEQQSPAPSGDSQSLDWLQDIQAESQSVSGEKPGEPALPDWFTQSGAETTPALPEEMAEPDWLSQPAAGEAAPMEPHALDADLPAWLKDSMPEEQPAPSGDSDLPSWLGSMPSLEGELPPEILPSADEELPVTAGLPEEPLIPSSEPRPTASEETFIPKPPFVTPEPIPLGKMDPIFTEVPDWLTAATPQPAEDTLEEATAGEEAPAITPGALPSWVQAMRPVEAASPAPGKTGELTLETKGALAGLQGVLPSTPYSGPSSKPKAISVKLQASEEQQNHANLLEQILLAETRPEPMIVQPRVVTQRALKIGIAVVLFLVILAAVFGGSSIFPMPVGWPREVQGALTAVEAVPPGSPVLVVFDYEPSLAGEMEAIAAPLLDHLIIRSHPRLTILSTSPTGSSLAEHLVNGPLRDLQYSDYTNLGYLAGGLGGVRGFAQDPLASMPLAADASPAWSLGPTQGIQRLSDYTAIIVIVDRADAGRTWIEQTRDLHGSSAFVVVASAQAGPMIQPYYESGQINGLVTGLFDAAVVEQSNAGRPGLARRYWDAYNLALMLAILLVGFGSLWSLVAGLRERASGEAG